MKNPYSDLIVMAKGKCAAFTAYKSLDYCKGRPILPGIRGYVYYISKRDVVTYPTLPEISDSADFATLSVLKGDFVLAADAKWKKITLTNNMGKFTFETQGDLPAVTVKNKGEFPYPDNDAEAASFARMAIYDDLLFLVPQRDGKYRLLGSKAFSTKTTTSGDSGEGNKGGSGMKIMVEADDVCPAPFYPGKIETEDGDISGATDEASV